MSERDDLIKDDKQRKREFEKQIADVEAEINDPRFADARGLVQAQEDLKQLQALESRKNALEDAESAAKGRFANALSAAQPEALRRLVLRARSDISISRRIGTDDVSEINRALLLRAWLEGVEAALADPGVTSKDLAGWQSRGEALVDPAVQLQVVR